MTTAIEGWDATHAGLPFAPKNGQSAGYITGSGDVPWTAEDKAAHPGYVQIDQSPVVESIDYTADAFDSEAGAITIPELPQLVANAQFAWRSGARPGQRWPAVYVSAGNVTAAVNELTAAGLACPLGVAHYGVGSAYAEQQIVNAAGPFPIVWFQYDDTGGGGNYDLDWFSQQWLTNVSVIPDPIIPKGTRMLHLSVTAPTGHIWTGTRTYLYMPVPDAKPQWIVDAQSEASIAAVFPVAKVTWGFYESIGGV